MNRAKLICLILLLSACERHRPTILLLSGATITGDVPVYVLAGQSNMAGTVNAGYPAISRVTMLYGAPKGPGYPFGADVTSGPIILVQCAVGGTTIDQWQAGGTLYNDCISRAKAAITPGRKLSGLLFYQGEQDAVNTTAVPWAQEFMTMAQSFRHELGNIPIVYAQIGPVSGAPNVSHIQQEQASVYLTNSAMITTADLPVFDGTHHSDDTNIEVGRRFSIAMRGIE